MVLVFNAKKRQTLAACAAGGLAALLSACSSTPLAPLATLTPLPPGAVPPPPLPPGVVPSSDPNQPPPAPREFRAVWVSTVSNIDWPSRSNLSVEKQQAEAIVILERAKSLNLNAIVLQVRPSADAIYPSELEPWSEYLTGQQGRPPHPLYDPLHFWIEQAHARGLELHAWFNPYRAGHASTARSPLAREHVSYTKPDMVKPYGKYLWIDPGADGASQHTLDVVLDVVRRYDVDGVHIDDYFYPYPVDAAGAESVAFDAGGGAKAELAFPDEPSWQRYLLGGGQLDRASWRRQNVNSLIEALYLGIHREKSWVRFGISPFGIGRPDRRPPGIVGFSQYDKLYADAETWLAKGWLDYLSPQLYWPVAQAPQAFDVLLDYWLAQNTQGRHVWPGLFTSRIDNSAKAFAPEEIVKQIGVTRTRRGADGHVHFSMAALMDNRKGIADLLRAQVYQTAALVPATPWLGTHTPSAPAVAVRREGAALALKLSAGAGANVGGAGGSGANAGRAVAAYALWSRYGAEWRFAVAPAGRTALVLPDDPVAGPVNMVVVSAIDRLGNESERVSVLR